MDTARTKSKPKKCSRNETFREQQIRTTVQLVVGEQCALAASSDLVNAAPARPSKLFLATQTLDEARHVEIFIQRLFDLSVKPGISSRRSRLGGRARRFDCQGRLLRPLDGDQSSN
jgi:hypothetical protein